MKVEKKVVRYKLTGVSVKISFPADRILEKFYFLDLPYTYMVFFFFSLLESQPLAERHGAGRWEKQQEGKVQEVQLSLPWPRLPRNLLEVAEQMESQAAGSR